MKKFLCALLASMLLLSCIGCSNSKTKDNNDSSTLTNSTVEDKKEENVGAERVMFGYSYAFNFANEANALSVGFLGKGKNYGIAIIEQGPTFSSWETAIADSRSNVSSLVYNATGYRGSSIEVVSSESVTNPQGIEILKADVVFNSVSKGKRNAFCYYFVNDKNEIFGFVALKEEGFEDEIKTSMDYMAENLKKAE